MFRVSYAIHGTLKENFRRMNIRIRSWCKIHQLNYARKTFSCKLIGVNRLPLSVNRKYPGTSRRIKAGGTRRLVHYLGFATRKALRFARAGDEFAQLRAVTLYNIRRLCYIFDHHGLMLSDSLCKEGVTCGQGFLLGYVKLASLAFAKRKKLYRIRPKLHYIAHQVLLLLSNPENPGKLSN